MSGRVDIAGLYAALDVARTARGLSWRDVAKEAGVSPSGLTRLSQGHRPDVDGFAALVCWLGVPAERFMPGFKPSVREADLQLQLALLLIADPRFRPSDRQFLLEVLAASIKRIERTSSSSETPAPGDEAARPESPGVGDHGDPGRATN